MNNEDLLGLAKDIAFVAHKGQVDKAGEDYILHPLRVSDRCETLSEKIVAVLHDVLEDTDITEEYLERKCFPKCVIEAIKSVTRKEKEPYEDFIVRCSNNPIGRKVKIHDLEDNMNITRLKELTDKDCERLKKYLKAYRYLLEVK